MAGLCTACKAVRDSTAASAPIVFAAGLSVAAGTGALVVARGGLLRAFGPGLTVTVLVSMVESARAGIVGCQPLTLGPVTSRPGYAHSRRDS